MKRFILSAVVLAISAIVWVHWGGFSNPFGGLVIALFDTLILACMAGKSERKVEKK